MKSKFKSIKLAFISNISYQLFEKNLVKKAHENDLKLSILETSFNNIYSDGMISNSRIKNFRPDYIVLFIDLYQLDDQLNLELSTKKIISQIKDLITSIKNNYNSKLIVCNFYKSYQSKLSNNDTNNFSKFINKINLGVINLQKKIKFLILDLEYLSTLIGMKNFLSKRNNFAFSFPFSNEGILSIVDEISLLIHRDLKNRKKLLILDLDNTLWPGVAAENINNFSLSFDIPENRAFLFFHKYIKKLKKSGILLAICSKNSPEIKKKIFNIKNFNFKSSDFVYISLSFDTKDKGIKKILEITNLSAKDTIFLDDNKFERELVKKTFPEMIIPEIGSDVENYVKVLDQNFYFYSNELTTEDLTRNKMISENKKRILSQFKSLNYDEYLNSLKMKIKITSLDKSNIERSIQLINKTNQFNFNGIRLTENEIKKYQSKNKFIYTIYLADKFGESGLISCIFGKFMNTSIIIENWVMSCRVFNRYVEHNIIYNLMNYYNFRNFKSLKINFIETESNFILKNFLKELNFTKLKNNFFEINTQKLIKQNLFFIDTKFYG